MVCSNTARAAFATKWSFEDASSQCSRRSPGTPLDSLCRKDRHEKLSFKEVAKAQLEAYAAYMQPLLGDKPYAFLNKVTQPTLVVNGIDDVMIATINSLYLAQNIPNALLILYPDAGHGAQFQYPGRFLKHALQFLDE